MTGLKYDTGKSPVVSGCLQYFSRALPVVAGVSDYGFKKYGSWGGWVGVPDGRSRYTNALGRHLLSEFVDPVDHESGQMHDAMVAWNALARLELRLIEEETQSDVKR